MTNWLKVLGAWKIGKTILSPATHMRNILTNSFWLSTRKEKSVHGDEGSRLKSIREEKK